MSTLAARNSSDLSACPADQQSDSHQLVLLTLTVPLWTFITFYLLLLLIHYLRRIQHFTLYDKCTTRNAHFKYEFHLVVGKYTSNYNSLESHLIVDLLDSQLISTMTIQIPGYTIFSDSQAFTYSHSRANLRCLKFTIYRRHPIKDVGCIRVAHSCANPDSRLFIYGINLNDSTNNENKFFPITSVVKYRGTQWALNTTFEPKNELSFAKLGCDCYDPFATSIWPTYVEILTLIFYLWCSVLCFGHLIPVNSILNSIPVHAITVTFISGSSAVVIAFVYLKLIKVHIVDQHFETTMWSLLKTSVLILVTLLSFAFWLLSSNQMKACVIPARSWMISSLSSGATLTIIFLLVYWIARRKKMMGDNSALDDSDNVLIKTNSKPNMEFVKEGTATTVKMQPTIVRKTSKGTKTAESGGSGRKKKSSDKKNKQKNSNSKQKGENETLETAFANSDSAYMKTKNRNSISQYV